MRELYPRKKRINSKIMLYSIEDEEATENSTNDDNYKDVFKKAYLGIRSMSIDKKVCKGAFFQSRERLDMVI